MNICECLTTTAKLVPERVALIFQEQPWTYAELDGQSLAAAGVLRGGGIEPGDRVALMLPNAPSFPVWYYACLRIGAIAVSISTRLAASEVAFVVEDCDAKAFIGSQQATDSSESELPQCAELQLAVDDWGQPIDAGQSLKETGIQTEIYNADPDEAALILYTSGTTGFPKGATLSHGNVRSNVHAFNHLCKMRPEDRVLLAVPLFHCFGQNALLNSVLNVGGTIVLQQRFDLAESKQLIADHKVTQLYGVPMMFGLLHESCNPEDLVSVNYCFSAAATLPIQTSLAWQEKFGQPIYEGYGLTETSPFATYNHRIKFVPGSIGMPIDSVEVKIVDPETGEACPDGKPGEIAIRGPNVMLGYWNRPEETAAAIVDGWFRSGDIGRLDDAGYLYIVDRVKDMIAVGGLKVFPAEVERVLLDHPSVAEAAVVGVPDAVMGEQVLAYLVFADGCDQQQAVAEVRHHVKEHLGNYKVPRQLIAIETLPRNPSGKVLKTKLRELAGSSVEIGEGENQASSESRAQPMIVSGLKPATLRDALSKVHRSEKDRVTTQFVCEMVGELGDLDEAPNPNASFIEAGLDSLAMVSLSSQLQIEVGPDPELPPTLLFDHPQIADLVTFLLATLENRTNFPPRKSENAAAIPDANVLADLRCEIEQMSEDDALAQLMKELD